METFLLNLKINGIKNINKELKINFYKKNLKQFNFDNYHLKGIFGKNGIGKTAIIKSIEIFKNIIFDRNYIYKNQEMLKNLINNETKIFEIELEFYINTGNRKLKIINHELKLSNKDNEIKIIFEKIQLKNLKNEVKKEIIQENDEFKINGSFQFDKNIFDVKENYLSVYNTSMLQFLSKTDDIYFKALIYTYKKVYTKFHNQDLYEVYTLDDLKKVQNYTDEDFDIIQKKMDADIIVSKDKYKYFENDLKGLVKFTKQFINNIEDIEIKKLSSNDQYDFIKFYIKYPTRLISLDFESMGLKNLINLYFIFKMAYNGAIIFIDEVDLSIHEVYLSKLLEYLGHTIKGQIIFTAHNVGTLETLAKFKQSIDFIDNLQNIQSWVQKGNINIVKYYKNGNIDNIPFNIDFYDFSNVFGSDES